MDALTTKSATYDGSKVTYYSYGTGPQALVFIHGWTCNSTLWNLQSPLFTKHRSLLIDLSGHGASDAPVREYSMEHFARSINAVLEHENVSKVVLIGHSMGGPVCTMTLRLFPEKVAGIVYVDCFFQLPQHYQNGEQRREIAKLAADDAACVRIWDSTFWVPMSPLELKERVYGIMLGTPKHVRVSALCTDSLPHAMGADEVYEIPAIRFVTPVYAQIDRHWEHHLPLIKTRLWEQNGHFLFLEDPERFNGEVEAFIGVHGLLQG